MSDWKTLHSKEIYKNPWTILREDHVLNPAGQEVTYAITSSTSASVYIVPIDENDNTYIVRQFRYPIQKDSWEAIAGNTDSDTLEDGARRELLEEAGLMAQSLTKLGLCHPGTGRSTYQCTVYIADGIQVVSTDYDQTDGIKELKKLPFSQVIEMIMSGQITCSQSIAAFFMAREYLQRRK